MPQHDNAYLVYKELESRVDKFEERLKKIEENLDKLSELSSAFQNAKGAFATLEWMGKTSKILTPLFFIVGVMSFDIKRFIENIVHFLGK